jgi:hypothetical protein
MWSESANWDTPLLSFVYSCRRTNRCDWPAGAASFATPCYAMPHLPSRVPLGCIGSQGHESSAGLNTWEHGPLTAVTAHWKGANGRGSLEGGHISEDSVVSANCAHAAIQGTAAAVACLPMRACQRHALLGGYQT